MRNPSELVKLKDVCRRAKIKREITREDMNQLSEALGPRFDKAWEALIKLRVKKYVFQPSGRIVWVVLGKEREYLLFPIAEFCSCNDFFFRVMDGEAQICYHLIAQNLAEALEKFEKIEKNDESYDSLMKNWKTIES